MQYLEIGIW